MSEQRLINILQLAYTPLSTYDFTMVKDDLIIKDFINSGKLYVIAQRPILTFENFIIDSADEENPILKFEIHQRGMSDTLICEFPLFQKDFDIPVGTLTSIAINYTYPKSEEKRSDYPMPLMSMANFVVCTPDGSFYWLSPEKLIYHYLRKALQIRIDGDITKFLKYKVHYIGKATEQDIVKRLTGHSHLQDVLALERPFHYGTLPAEEIALILLSFQDNIFMNTFSDNDTDIDLAVRMLMGEPHIDQDTIYLDAEKALISALQPKHNKLRYKNYPISKDGLHNQGLDIYSFSINDPITLQYENGEIVGRNDHLLIQNGKLQIRKGQ